MIIGLPKEIKNEEYRVALIPSAVKEIVDSSNKVYIEKNYGVGAGYIDNDYIKVGAKVLDNAEDIFAKSDMIIKVKEPQKNECSLLREGQILFTYLHLASDIELAKLLQKSGVRAVGYETVTSKSGALPLLHPMSMIAGKLATQLGAYFLLKFNQTKGILLSSMPGVESGRVTIIGAGAVGQSAMRVAIGLGANITILDNSIEKLSLIEQQYSGLVTTIYSNAQNIYEACTSSDLVIGSVLIPGAKAPKLITSSIIKDMKEGSVIVDVAIDQGGSTEVSKPTSHQNPTYKVGGTTMYCVTNMPGCVPVTSSQAISNAVLPFVMQIANKGLDVAMQDNPHIKNGLQVDRGQDVHPTIKELL